MRQSHSTYAMLTVLPIALCLCIASLTLVNEAGATIVVEAESLLDSYGDPAPLQPVDYAHASGGVVVYLRHGHVVWPVNIEQPGGYALWIRARAGWSDDHFGHDGQLRLKLGTRDVRMTLIRSTLDYHGDGENFAWFKSEPINLDRGEVEFTVSSAWEWAHVDQMLLTQDQAFEPSPGNVATAISRLGSDWVVWTVHPDSAFDPRQAPPTNRPEAKIDLLSPRNGRAYGAIMLHNSEAASNIAHLLLRLPEMRRDDGHQLDASHLRVHRLATTGLRAGLLASDALPRINEMGYLELAPGYSTMLWVCFDLPKETLPGRYRGNLLLEDQVSLKNVSVPITLEVSPVILPNETKLVVFSWWGASHMPESWWDDQIVHGVNTFKISVQSYVDYAFDEQGRLKGAIDFSRMDQAVDTVRRTGGYLLLEWDLHVPERANLQCRVGGAPSGSQLQLMSPAWQRAFTTLMTKTTAYVVDQGVPSERVLQYIFDEYLGENFVAVAELIRKTGSMYNIFSNLSANLATYQKVASYVDVWCPHFKDLVAMNEDGRLAFMQETGKPIWFYDEGYNQRAASPFSKYRHKFWLAAAYDLDGCTYWKHQGDRVGTAYYPLFSTAAPVTSRRYEAWARGVEDYKLLTMLKSLANAGEDGSHQAAALWQEAVEAVKQQPIDPQLADTYRREIIRMLERHLHN